MPGRYEVATADGVAILIDTATGKTWRACHEHLAGPMQWCPVSKHRLGVLTEADLEIYDWARSRLAANPDDTTAAKVIATLDAESSSRVGK